MSKDMLMSETTIKMDQEFIHPFQKKPQEVVVTTEVHGPQAECSGAQAVGQGLTTRHQAAAPKGARKSVASTPRGSVKVSQVCCQFSEREMAHFAGGEKHFEDDHFTFM